MKDGYQVVDMKHTKGGLRIAIQSVHLLVHFRAPGQQHPPTQHSFEARPGTRPGDNQVFAFGQSRTGLRAMNEIPFLRRTDRGSRVQTPFLMHMYQAQR